MSDLFDFPGEANMSIQKVLFSERPFIIVEVA